MLLIFPYSSYSTKTGYKPSPKPVDVVKINPTDAKAWHCLGVIYLALDQHHKAIECQLKALELNPLYEDARLALAASYGDSGNSEKAVEYLKQVVKPNDIFLQTVMGFYYKKMGKIEEAIACFDDTTKTYDQVSSTEELLAILGKGMPSDMFNLLKLKISATKSLRSLLRQAGYRIEMHYHPPSELIVQPQDEVDFSVFDNGLYLKSLIVLAFNEDDPHTVKWETAELQEYKRSYVDSNTMMVIAVPCGDYFYLKDLNEFTDDWLNEKCGPKWSDKEFLLFDLTDESDFEKLESVFPKIDIELRNVHGNKLKLSSLD